MADGECKALSLLCRIAALGLSVAAAVVMGTASQLVIVDGGGGSPPVSSSSTYSVVSYSQYNALRYFVAAGGISAVCSAVALYLFAVGSSLQLLPSLDAATQGFLFSAAGAAFAARDVVGAVGGSVTGTAAGRSSSSSWGSSAGGGGGSVVSVCDVAGAFCGRVTVAATVCAFAAVSASIAALARDAAGHSSSGSGRRRCEW